MKIKKLKLHRSNPIYPCVRAKTGVLLSVLLNVESALAQFTETFSDGDFSSNPVWTGGVTRFTIDNNRLRLQAPAVTDVAHLSTVTNSINNATWEWYIRFDFNPSSGNYARVYLVSDQADVTGSLNGYYVSIGDTPDDVSLYVQTGTTRTKIIDGLDGRVNTDPVEANVRVTRDGNGNWELFSDAGVTGTYTSEGTINDITHLSSTYFGVFCNYTSTRSNHFYFDDFAVSGDPYVPPPPSQYKDVIVTEILADPSPTVGLPDAEFVELYNRSTSAINLGGWKFTDGSSIATLSSFTLQSDSYVIVTAATSAALFTSWGSPLGTSNFPALNNEADNVSLRDAYDNLIDQVNYSDSWYRDDDKKAGGWTLELIDPENICSEEENWVASESPAGGTPGQLNSVKTNNPDLTGPKLLSAIPISPDQLKLVFNEKLDKQAPLPSDFVIVPTVSISAVTFFSSTLRELLLDLSTPLQTSQTYTLTAGNLFDCAGNAIQSEFKTVNFGLPEPAAQLDLAINEILFNPRSFGVDFVEVYNRSEKFINLNGWAVANYENGVPVNNQVISPADFLIAPNTYIGFTTDPATVKSHYPLAVQENLSQLSVLPPFNDDEGTVALVDNQGTVIDHFSYTDDFHSPLLRDKEGVSLERIHADEVTEGEQNWKSAASTVGFATPGYRNSNAVDVPTGSGKVSVEPEIFIPLIGQPSFTEIRYAFNQGGKVANIKILDQQGREIKRLANNETLATDGFFRWDGDRDDGTQARVGYYVVWFEVFDTSGNVETFRKRIVVAARY